MGNLCDGERRVPVHEAFATAGSGVGRRWVAHLAGLGLPAGKRLPSPYSTIGEHAGRQQPLAFRPAIRVARASALSRGGVAVAGGIVDSFSGRPNGMSWFGTSHCWTSTPSSPSSGELCPSGATLRDHGNLLGRRAGLCLQVNVRPAEPGRYYYAGSLQVTTLSQLWTWMSWNDFWLEIWARPTGTEIWVTHWDAKPLDSCSDSRVSPA